MNSTSEPARLALRLLSLTYETIIVAAVLLAGTALFVSLFGDSRQMPLRLLLQFWLLALCGAYFTWGWSQGRQTLPMRTWRLAIVAEDGRPIDRPRALRRYLLAVVGCGLVGLTFWWALIDRERRFLHDRLAGTRVVRTETPGGRREAPTTRPGS